MNHRIKIFGLCAAMLFPACGGSPTKPDPPPLPEGLTVHEVTIALGDTISFGDEDFWYWEYMLTVEAGPSPVQGSVDLVMEHHQADWADKASEWATCQAPCGARTGETIIGGRLDIDLAAGGVDTLLLRIGYEATVDGCGASCAQVCWSETPGSSAARIAWGIYEGEDPQTGEARLEAAGFDLHSPDMPLPDSISPDARAADEKDC